MFIFLVLAWCAPFTIAFNLDTNSPIIFEDPLDNKRSSYFGYSMALLLEKSTKTSWLLVGAPRGNSSSDFSRKVDEPGVSLLCGISPIKPCVEYVVKSKTKYRQSWIGGTIASQQSTGRFAVCGHRFAKYRSKEDQSYLTGACFVSDVSSWLNETESFYSNMLSPFELLKAKDIVDTEFAMYGISATFPKGEKHELLVGAPGKLDFCGTTVLCQDAIKGYAVERSSVLNSFNILKPLASNNAYLGYTVVEGHFWPDFVVPAYASSAPRAFNTRGEVFIFTVPEYGQVDPQIYAVLTGKQTGALFGAALASGDMNRDGVDELAIGAPLDSAENGAVFIYSFSKYDGMTLISEARGSHGEQLGSSLAMADLDGDDRVELIAAAPIRHELRVYVIRGESSVSLQLIQTIQMSTLDFQPKNIILDGFPSSFAVGDVDGNGVPDISVGAHKSGHAIIIRGRPVVKLEVNILEQPQTLLINSTGFKITVCAKYSGRESTKEFFTWRNVSTDSRTRSVYNGQKRVRVRLVRDKVNCADLNVTLSKTNKDFLKPILLHISYEHDVIPETFSPTLVLKRGAVLGKDTFCSTCGILPKPVQKTVTIPFATECRNNNICNSRLIINAIFLNSSGTLVVGERFVSFEVNVENDREPAYDCNLHVSALQKRARMSQLPPLCDCPSDTHCPSAKCELGNPLRGKSKQFKFVIDVGDLRIDDHNLTINLEATTGSQLINHAKITIHLILLVDANLILTGKSEEQSNIFHITDEIDTSSESILYHHLYEVQSVGISPVDTAILTVRMPYGLNYGGEISIFSGMYPPEVFNENKHFYCDYGDFQYLKQDSSDNGEEDTNYESSLDLPDSRAKRAVNQITAYNRDPFTSIRSNIRTKRSIQHLDRYQIVNTTDLPLNRTLWINCSHPDTTDCNQIKCKIGPLMPQSITRLLITSRLNTSVLKEALGQKDIIAIVSSGSIEVIESWRSEQLAYGQQEVKRYDVSSVFTSAPQDALAPAWLYVLSGCIGLLLIIVIVLGLFKAGFFRRKIKEEIKAIKEEVKRKSVMITTPKIKPDVEPEENIS